MTFSKKYLLSAAAALLIASPAFAGNKLTVPNQDIVGGTVLNQYNAETPADASGDHMKKKHKKHKKHGKKRGKKAAAPAAAPTEAPVQK